MSLRIVETPGEVDAAQWNALAASHPSAQHAASPFLRHEFLSALIDSGCASPRTGWRPCFLLLERGGSLAGAMPLFWKTHSRGEYVFDWAWAEAHARHGLAYYPKLLGAVPFTPVAGARLLAPRAEDRERLLAAALAMARESSSLHVLFAAPEDARLMQAQGMQLRRTVQFHWHNRGYVDFEAFLADLTRARRKNIRQERRRVREAGVAFRRVAGEALDARHWEFFHRCYRNTYAAHGSSPYLSLDFFRRIGAAMPQHVVLFLAERDAQPVAASLCLRDERRLYGRYWGAVEHIPLLHFEACYYQPIEYAIDQGLAVFEGGAQGEHKIWRGLTPVEALSGHWLAHAGLGRAVEEFLAREASGVGRYVDELNEHSPFREDQRPAGSPAGETGEE